jgi:hypothetical protein
MSKLIECQYNRNIRLESAILVYEKCRNYILWINQPDKARPIRTPLFQLDVDARIPKERPIYYYNTVSLAWSIA